MAAQTITNLIAPRLEFIAAASNGAVIVRVYDTQGNIWGECDISGATWTALATAMGTPGTKYIPKNVGANPIGDGRITFGGQLSPEVWPGIA